MWREAAILVAALLLLVGCESLEGAGGDGGQRRQADVAVVVTPSLNPEPASERADAPEDACPVYDPVFCDVVEDLALAIEASDSDAFISYVAFRPCTCSGEPGYVQSCSGEPAGTVIECALAAALQGEGTCATEEEYVTLFFPDFEAVYAVSYPTSRTLSEMLERDTGPLVFVKTADDFRDVALELEPSKHGWDISWTYWFIADEACSRLGGCVADEPLLVGWP